MMLGKECRQVWLHHGIITLIAATVFFLNLGGPNLWDRDETRNARCTVEMLERGDWVVPYYNGQLRDIKPAGMYWFMMSAVSIFGATEFAFRFWSAVAGLVTALVTYHIGRRLFAPEVGLWGGIILSSSLMFAVLARAAKVDSLLILLNALVILLFAWATFRPTEAGEEPAKPTLRWPGHYYPRSPWVVGMMFALMGAAVLGKGPIGVILPTAVIGMFLLLMQQPATGAERPLPEPSLHWGRGGMLTAGWILLGLLLALISLEFGAVVLLLLGVHLFVHRLPIFRPFAPGHFLATCWSMRPVTAIAAMAMVALPWHVWVTVRDARWIEGFYLVHNFGRAATAMENHSGSDLLYYPVTMALGLAPWSVFLAPVVIDLVQRIRQRDPWRVSLVLMACWVGVYVGLFSLAETKLPNYIVPAYPAMALIAGCYIYHLRRATLVSAAWWPRVAMGVLAISGLGLLIGLPVAASIYLPGDAWLGIVGLIPIAGAAVCGTLFRQKRARAATICFAGCAILLVSALLAGVAQRIDRHQQIPELLRTAFENHHEPHIASFAGLEPSWVHYSGQNIREFKRGEVEQVKGFLESGHDRFLITSDESWELLHSELPRGASVVADCRRFLQNGRLLLIRGASANAKVARIPSSGDATGDKTFTK